jgi:hypothetical protein
MVGQQFETISRAEKFTVELALPEDGADEPRNAPEYQTNSVTWCMKDGALSAGFTFKF